MTKLLENVKEARLLVLFKSLKTFSLKTLQKCIKTLVKC